MTRSVTLVLVDSGGTVLGALPPFTVDLPWWAEMVDVVDGARDRYGAAVTVLRLLSTELPRQPGGAVTYLAEVSAHPPHPLTPVTVDLSPHPLRAPYAEPGGPAESLRWAAGALRTLGRGAPTRIVQRKTWNLSALWMLETDRGPVWLKHLPGFLRAETAVLEWVATVAPGAAPPLLAADGAGRELLGHLPGEDRFGAPATERYPMIDLLHGVQRRASDMPDHLADRGVPDLRGDRLAERVAAVAQPHLPAVPGLAALVADLPRRLAAVRACGLPDTLAHGDFHPGNGRSGPDTGPAVLDWGDAFLGHPGFDILRLVGGLDPVDAGPLLDHWARLWRRVVPGCDPLAAVGLLRPVAPLLGAVVYAGFLANIEPDEWPYHADDVPDCLREAVVAA